MYESVTLPNGAPLRSVLTLHAANILLPHVRIEDALKERSAMAVRGRRMFDQ